MRFAASRESDAGQAGALCFGSVGGCSVLRTRARLRRARALVRRPRTPAAFASAWGGRAGRAAQALSRSLLSGRKRQLPTGAPRRLPRPALIAAIRTPANVTM